ncbi:MAG: GDP-mannose 4,6-dehydratase [Spirochaetales bacterium]|nr:GDP-mannose 4,6-dehydratase [Spirochaetales bacterium]
MDKESRILITGSSGLAGTWLRKALEENGFSRIFLLDLVSSGTENREYTGSINDSAFLHSVIKDVQPSHIFHLAGLVGHRSLEEMRLVNVEGTRKLLEAVRDNKLLATRILITSSSAVYGDKGILHITEDMPTSPTSNYSNSKAGQEEVSRKFFIDHGMPVIISRAFNNTAPGEKEYMFIARIASRIAKIEKKQLDKLSIGPLHSIRDYIDTRDLVDAYILLMKKGIPGEVYNICSGRPVQISELFYFLIENAKVPVKYEVIEYDQTGNIPFQCGSPDKIKQLTGWYNKRDIKNTLLEILDSWRNQV